MLEELRMLKVETRYQIDAYEMDKAIQEYFDVKDYCFQQLLERPNDSYYSVVVSPWDMYSKENWSDVIALREDGDEDGLIQCYLGHLCFLGEIPEGDYLINVCW